MDKNEFCAYKTPCGWCAKWDKECDKKMYNTNRLTINPEDTLTFNYLTHTNVRGCDTCDKKGWDMPECHECNKENDYKWYERQDSLVKYLNVPNNEKH